MPAFIPVIRGARFGFLTLTGEFEYRGTKSIKYVECRCDCGSIKYIRMSALKIDEIKSCGCKKVELNRPYITKHGLCKSPIHEAWANMKSRCYNKNNPEFNDYGGRGINVCKEWKDDFISFYYWSINNGWIKGLTIDRFPNNNGNYEPDNCRWATYLQQNRNTRKNVMISAFGEIKCVAEWSTDPRCKVKKGTLISRLKNCNWNPEKSIITPITI